MLEAGVACRLGHEEAGRFPDRKADLTRPVPTQGLWPMPWPGFAPKRMPLRTPPCNSRTVRHNGPGAPNRLPRRPDDDCLARLRRICGRRTSAKARQDMKAWLRRREEPEAGCLSG